MDLVAMTLNKNNRLITDYKKYTSEIQNYFHYHPLTDSEKRYEDLMTQTYHREELVDLLTEMNGEWDAPEASLNQINRLASDESVVVVGGQQAGLLTGPMYSLNKVISIIKYARKQEKLLKKPVIPLFWIAGEDHDFDEINHTFTIRENSLKKHTINQYEPIKKSVDELVVDQEACLKWLKTLVNDMPETVYTKSWYDETVEALSQSSSYVDFFARLIFKLFQDEGIVLFNAHDQRARRFERDYFNQLFDQHEAIAGRVAQSKQMMENQGYVCALDASHSDVHLFYHDDHGERILLKSEAGKIVGKKNEVDFTKDELSKLIQKHPEKFSNNVVTRPMMQELVFPTLAFIAGDGEIAYWATLKQAFEVLDLKMPPIVPRLSFTYLDDKLLKLADQREIAVETVIKEGTMLAKQNWLIAQQPLDVSPLFTMTKENIKKLYEPLEKAVESINHDLKRDAQKNLTYIFNQVDYLKKRVQDETELKYQNELKQFDVLEYMLYPNHGLQERAFSPYLMINQHGKSFIHKMINDHSITFENDHYLVHLD